MMSHELREPMNGVLGMARLLADTSLSQDQQTLVDTIVESAEALLTVLNDLLDLSRLAAGRFDLRAVAFDPRLVAGRAMATFEQKANGKNIRLELEVDKHVPTAISGDPGRLRQILVNLMGNAVKFTDDGTVRLVVRPAPLADAPAVLFQVQDTGRGFDQDGSRLPADPFARQSTGTLPMFGGSGLGLTICSALASAMGGRLEIASRAGAGTCAILLLPAVPADGVSGELHPVSLAGLHLLIVEALPDLRERLRRAASAWGLLVRGAAGLDDALREIHEARTRGTVFDLAIIGATLDDRSVAALVAALRREAGQALRVVCLATSGLRGDAARAGSLGLDGYLATPFSDEDLMQMLIRIVQDTERNRVWTRHDVQEGIERGLRILVADDNPVNCRLAELLLAKAGHAVTTVPDGARAVAAVEAGDFDLVLMDVQMPVMDGLQATRAIRLLSDERRSTIPVVALTAEAMSGDEKRILASGMDGYLTKPIDRPKLLSTVQFWATKGRSTGSAATFNA